MNQAVSKRFDEVDDAFREDRVRLDEIERRMGIGAPDAPPAQTRTTTLDLGGISNQTFGPLNIDGSKAFDAIKVEAGKVARNVTLTGIKARNCTDNPATPQWAEGYGAYIEHLIDSRILGSVLHLALDSGQHGLRIRQSESNRLVNSEIDTEGAHKSSLWVLYGIGGPRVKSATGVESGGEGGTEQEPDLLVDGCDIHGGEIRVGTRASDGMPLGRACVVIRNSKLLLRNRPGQPYVIAVWTGATVILEDTVIDGRIDIEDSTARVVCRRCKTPNGTPLAKSNFKLGTGADWSQVTIE